MAQVAMTAEPTDRVLLDGVRHGDERAFEVLFERYFPGVYGAARRVVGSPEEAEEIALDAFVRLYQRPIADTDDANVRGWLHRVATNAAFNAVRARRRRRNWFQRLAARRELVNEHQADPLDLVSTSDEAAWVRARLAELPERQRTALVLRSAGLSYAEIAEALGVNLTSVGTILARAERALRKQLGVEMVNGGGRDG
jgi:RNA polymerase sigma-70 factor (ECF subfamily)